MFPPDGPTDSDSSLCLWPAGSSPVFSSIVHVVVAPGSGYVEDDSDFVPNNTATLVGWPLVLLYSV